jgi:DNA repair ATPase RecN
MTSNSHSSTEAELNVLKMSSVLEDTRKELEFYKQRCEQLESDLRTLQATVRDYGFRPR